MRIISVVPSQTELLHYLGLEIEVVGITIFCIHPDEWFKKKYKVGGTKTLDLDKIRSLKPDLIIANKEENEKEQIEALQKEFKVYVSEIEDLEGALKMIREVGDLTNKKVEATELVGSISRQYQSINKFGNDQTVAYLIWKDPMMLAGKNTFIDDQLHRLGFVNVCTNVDGRYPELDNSKLKTLNPELVFLSSEPFPFSEKHISELQTFFPNARLVLVDGEYFSWYGSRLLEAPRYFLKLQNELSNPFPS